MTLKPAAAITLLCASLLPVSAFAWCVGAPEANLRTGPGTRYEKSWQVFKYMPLRKVGQRGSWYQVKDVDGDRHWIHKPLLTNSMRCAVVKADGTNVRTGPGTRYGKSPLSPVDKYYSFRVIGSKGSWLKVRDEMDNEGWVTKSLLWVQ